MRPETISSDVREFLAQRRQGLLRFITCGGVDDGKSTLIGRLLHDTRAIYEDQLAAVAADSARFGTTGADPDLALLVDGLQAEREQGITIDVAYRHFSTNRRRFVIADTPGHEQYTRNMVTGASTADLAVILVDARKGVLTQTRRHSFLVSLLGIRQVIVAVNKMDLVGFDREAFERVRGDYQAFAGRLELDGFQFVPVSALLGDNVVARSERTPWYRGGTLLELLETLDPARRNGRGDLRFPVQLVNRPSPEFRGYCGTVAAGVVRAGEEVMVLPARKTSRIREIVTYDGPLESASAGQAVTLTLEDDLDIARGDMLVHPDAAPGIGKTFDAHLVWLDEAPLLPGRQYEVKFGPKLTRGHVGILHHRVDVNTLERTEVERLQLNEIGLARFHLSENVPLDAYDAVPGTGAFIMIDPLSNATVGAGMVTKAVPEVRPGQATNLVWHEHRVSKVQRAGQKGQKPCVLWFTGLSGSGKSTIANALEAHLFRLGHHTYLLDGDNVRHGLNRDLGFSDEDRIENIRRVGETAKLFTDAGLIVLTAFISPFRGDRELVRSLLPEGEFIEVHVDAPLEVCEQRDPKGLYAKARRGLISNFTGIDSPYEPPTHPDVTLHTERETVAECVGKLVEALARRGVLAG